MLLRHYCYSQLHVVTSLLLFITACFYVNISSNIGTPLYTIYDLHQLLYVSVPRCHPHRAVITNVHNFFIINTWYTNFLFIHINYIKLNSSTCFERNPLIVRRSTTQIVHMQPLVSSGYQRLHMYNWRRWPPDDERIALETCTGI